jgi:hypothetical protein
MTVEEVLALGKHVARDVRSKINSATATLHPRDRVLVCNRLAAYLRQIANELEQENMDSYTDTGNREMY